MSEAPTNGQSRLGGRVGRWFLPEKLPQPITRCY